MTGDVPWSGTAEFTGRRAETERAYLAARSRRIGRRNRVLIVVGIAAAGAVIWALLGQPPSRESA